MNEQKRIDLTNSAIKLIIENKGKLAYNDMHAAVLGQKAWTADAYMAYFLAMSVVCHNIPQYKDNKEIIRDIDVCFRDAITFLASNIAETEIIQASRTNKLVGCMCGIEIKNLSFFDDTHEYFTFGKGNKNPDLIDEHGITFEVKLNYESGSPSSLHAAKVLFNCKTNTVEHYTIYCDEAHKTGYANVHFLPNDRFKDVLSSKITKPCDDVAKLLGGWLTALYSGELIREIENGLKHNNFMLYNK